MVFSPTQNKLYCEHCTKVNSIETKNAEGKKSLHEQVELITVESKLIHCDSCGADSALNGDYISKSCSYCGAPVVNTSTKGVSRPDSIIPFKVNKQNAQEHLKSWLSGLWFAPNSLKKFAKSSNLQDMKGCYIPFWRFDTETHTEYTGSRGEYYYDTKTREVNGKTETYQERRTEWRNVSGEFDKSFKNCLDLAQTKIPDHLVDDLGPWDFNRAKKFEEKFLLGFETLLVNKNMKDSWKVIQKEIQEDLKQESKRDIGGDEQRLTTCDVSYSNEKYDQISLPLWIGAYRFNSKVYRICVNGQTGKIDGERPYSVIKIALATLVALAVGTIAFGYYTDNQAIIGPINNLLGIHKSV